MRFAEMKYRRPDTAAVEMAYRDMAQRFPLCASAKEQLELLDKHEKLWYSGVNDNVFAGKK